MFVLFAVEFGVGSTMYRAKDLVGQFNILYFLKKKMWYLKR
jgi:hypothetical protein